MRRREVLAGLLAAAIPAPARGQGRPRVVILPSGYPSRTPIRPLFEELGKLGYEDGSTAVVELLGGEGDPDRIDGFVAHLARQKPDVIIAITSPAVLALKRAGVTTPVVFAFVPDPVRLGVIERLSRPGG